MLDQVIHSVSQTKNIIIVFIYNSFIHLLNKALYATILVACRWVPFFFVKTMFIRTLWLRLLKNYEHAKNMAEIAKILRTFQPGGKYLKTFSKSIAFSANF